MPVRPAFGYFLYRPDAPVGEGSGLWETPLPAPPGFSEHSSEDAPQAPATLGAYFTAARRWLEGEGRQAVLTGLERRTGSPVRPGDLEKIDIRLEKHGRFCHPGRITAATPETSADFVLNLALSRDGLNLLRQETGSLEKLNSAFSRSYLPRVFGAGEIPLEGGGRAGMFLGEWFEGFHEFHLSRDPGDGRLGIVIWDPEAGNYFLDALQTRSLYRRIAEILTYYYNPETCEQIIPWRHAAGDFIVRLRDGRADVKLITVRGYRSVINQPAPDPGVIIQALLLFLMDMCIRMRLDRLDGDGDIAWAPDMAVDAALEGFFGALAEKPVPEGLPAPFAEFFMEYVSSCSTDDFMALSESIAGACYAGAPELPLIRARLGDHARTLHRRLS